MPEQSSDRGNVITVAPFENPFENHAIRFGVLGLNLKQSLDAMEGFSRLTNVDHDQEGELTVRPGQTLLVSGGTAHHSVRKLYDPRAQTTTRIWGIDSSVYRGASGALTVVEAGFSGDPLALVPHRPTFSGESWMFIGDRSQMRKVRDDGLSLPIGLPAPGSACASALGTEYRRTIAEMDAADSTEAAQWVGTGGVDTDGNPAGVPIATDDLATAPSGAAVRFRTTAGSISSAYDSWWGVPKALSLAQIDPVGGGGAIDASDDDFIHLYLLFSLPHLLVEARIYFVVSSVFDPAVLPGTINAGSANTDAYVKGFRQNDFAQFIQGVQSQADASEVSRVQAIRDDSLQARAIVDARSTWAALRAERDPARRLALQAASGSYQWMEFGVVGAPLRRGDFQRIGITSGRDWSTITGIVLYVRTEIDAIDHVVVVGLDDIYCTGGYGPDTAEPGAQMYDYKVTHYDPRTGAESNGSPEQTTANQIDSLRRQIVVTPAAGVGDAAVRQRVYRRGGSNIANWDFVGVNTSDGGAFTDQLSDEAIAAAGVIPIDHFQPVPTVDENGDAVLGQAVRALWGPIDGILMACGDPYRPGHVYFCNADAPDHWSSAGWTEVCAPSEELMNGGIYGSQAFVFSRLRLHALYPNLTGTLGVTATPTLCKRGLWHYWTFCTGPGGIYFLAEDGIFQTVGGPEKWLSEAIDPLFHGETVNGYLPIDLDAKAAIRMTTWENKLYVLYQDTGGSRHVFVYSFLKDHWRIYDFGRALSVVQGEEEPVLVLGSLNQGESYTHEGTSDDGLAISVVLRTGAFSGGRREEKLFGDQVIDADRDGIDISVTNYLNEETVTNLAQALDDGSGRQRYILDGFGESPQKAHSISTEISWSSAAAQPILFQMFYAITLQPDITNRRVTNWDDLDHADESWVTGITLDCDTAGLDKTVVIERDFEGARTTIDTLIVNADGRHKIKFSWPAVPAHMVRIRPEEEDCVFWILYRADWIHVPEPPRISKWDIHFEGEWDQYYTGLDLFCDTFNQEKRIEVYVDGVRLTNDLAGGLTYWPVTANGRQVVHLTLPWGRGHVFRFIAVDDNVGLLYKHRWHTDPEPSEQANWNQNFSIYGTRADKYLKAVIFECDTFGQNKSVQVEVDGTTVETLTVNADGRRVVQLALTTQQLGRVWRMFPVDGNPGRLYTAQPVFDEEPFKLNRWETQETNHGLPGWFYPTFGHLTLKSATPVTLTLTKMISQSGRTVTETYEIPDTNNLKQRVYQSFCAGKCVLIKYVLTSTEPFWLYRDETVIYIQPWGASDPVLRQPFGNDDLDPTRTMTNAVGAASRPGGGTA